MCESTAKEARENVRGSKGLVDFFCYEKFFASQPSQLTYCYGGKSMTLIVPTSLL
jgi:hypothetical protein